APGTSARRSGARHFLNDPAAVRPRRSNDDRFSVMPPFVSSVSASLSRRRFLPLLATGLAATGRGWSEEPRPSPPPRLRAGQIGTTHSHAAGKLEAVRRLTEHYEVVGVVEPQDEQRKKVGERAAYAGLPWMTEAELLARPDVNVVVVET